MGIQATGRVIKQDYDNRMLPTQKFFSQSHEKINS